MKITTQKLAQVAVEWSQIAGEAVITEVIGGVLYGFCTELGALRLEHKFNAPHAKAIEAKGCGDWAFRLENASFELVA